MKTLHRRRFLQTVLGAGAATAIQSPATSQGASQNAAPPRFDFTANLIAAPDDPHQWPAFRASLIEWRQEAKTRLNYDDSLYRRRDFAWVPSCFSCCFLMMCDETFYHPGEGRYTVASFLDL